MEVSQVKVRLAIRTGVISKLSINELSENDEDIDLVSCPSSRLDDGFNDLAFERIKAALKALLLHNLHRGLCALQGTNLSWASKRPVQTTEALCASLRK